MKKLTDRIRHHNSWRRGEHSDTYDVTKIGLDLDLIVNEHDKLTEQNKSLKSAIKTACDKASKVGCDGVVMMSVENFNALVAAYNECSDD